MITLWSNVSTIKYSTCKLHVVRKSAHILFVLKVQWVPVLVCLCLIRSGC